MPAGGEHRALGAVGLRGLGKHICSCLADVAVLGGLAPCSQRGMCDAPRLERRGEGSREAGE